MRNYKIAFLAVKIKSLAAESQLIRHDEGRYKALSKKTKASPWTKSSARDAWLGMKAHRRGDVRREARAALLAYGFLRGRSYRIIEQKNRNPVDAERVAILVSKYGQSKVGKDDIKKWLDPSATPPAQAPVLSPAGRTWGLRREYKSRGVLKRIFAPLR